MRQGWTDRRWMSPSSCVVVSLLLTGCTITRVQAGETLSLRSRWVVLPFSNLADTPRAGERVASISGSILRIRGVQELLEYRDAREMLPELDDGHRLQDAITWAKAAGYSYGVTGTVEEWRYRGGTDGDPAVGVNLRVIDLVSGRTLWTASGSRAGWQQDTASGTAQRLLGQLLDQLDLR